MAARAWEVVSEVVALGMVAVGWVEMGWVVAVWAAAVLEAGEGVGAVGWEKAATGLVGGSTVRCCTCKLS